MIAQPPAMSVLAQIRPVGMRPGKLRLGIEKDAGRQGDAALGSELALAKQRRGKGCGQPRKKPVVPAGARVCVRSRRRCRPEVPQPQTDIGAGPATGLQAEIDDFLEVGGGGPRAPDTPARAGKN